MAETKSFSEVDAVLALDIVEAVSRKGRDVNVILNGVTLRCFGEDGTLVSSATVTPVWEGEAGLTRGGSYFPYASVALYRVSYGQYYLNIRDPEEAWASSNWVAHSLY